MTKNFEGFLVILSFINPSNISKFLAEIGHDVPYWYTSLKGNHSTRRLLFVASYFINQCEEEEKIGQCAEMHISKTT